MTRRKRPRPRRRYHYGPGFSRSERRISRETRRSADVFRLEIPYDTVVEAPVEYTCDHQECWPGRCQRDGGGTT